jgi:hypothetical protein
MDVSVTARAIGRFHGPVAASLSVAARAVVCNDIVVTVDTRNGRQTVFMRELVDSAMAIGAIEITVNGVFE